MTIFSNPNSSNIYVKILIMLQIIYFLSKWCLNTWNLKQITKNVFLDGTIPLIESRKPQIDPITGMQVFSQSV